MRHGRVARDIPPPLELQCLSAIWELGEANVQAVKDSLAKPLAYTTVMTMLDRLTRKQMLGRRKVGRSFVYTPLVTREDIRRRAVRELVDALFAGNESELKAYLDSAPKLAATAAAPEPLANPLDAALL